MSERMPTWAKVVMLLMVAWFAVFNWKFVEIQRWSCTHVMNCGCGQGYRAVYHGVDQPITCRATK